VIGLSWGHEERIHLIWAVLALIGLLVWLELRGSDLLGRFLSATMARRLASRPSPAVRATRLALIGLCLVTGVLALAEPRSLVSSENVSAEQMSADVMVVLDVSRSMLAEDAAPSRLERAKVEIGELVAAMKRHRFGLIAFAGRASLICPLTTDQGYFRMVLDGVSTDTIKLGGTKIGTAVDAAVSAFGAGSGARLIVLITDGEDHDSYPMEAADRARQEGIRVVSIGFGSEEGSPITLTDPKTGARTQLRDRDDKVVISRLDGKLLRDIAEKTEGAYVPAGTSGLDLESIVAERIEPIAREGAEAGVRTVPAERYPWFVLASLLFLIAATAVGGAASPEVEA